MGVDRRHQCDLFIIVVIIIVFVLVFCRVIS
jgi:hypothetical protein